MVHEKSAVVCDDDALVRTVIARILEDIGVAVVGEADTPDELLDVMARTGASIVILDLALRAGHGEHVLGELCRRHTGVHVVVFSAYVADPLELLDAGAAAVVEKPDFQALQSAVEDAADKGSIPDRRRPPPRMRAPMPPPAGVTLSGLEPWGSFTDAVDLAATGDALLAIDIVPNPSVAPIWDAVYRTDYRLAAARAVGATRREHDRISLTPEGLPVVLVLGGHPEAPTTMFERLQRVWAREIATGIPVGAFSHVGVDVGPRDALGAVIACMRQGDLRPEHPLRPA